LRLRYRNRLRLRQRLRLRLRYSPELGDRYDVGYGESYDARYSEHSDAGPESAGLLTPTLSSARRGRAEPRGGRRGFAARFQLPGTSVQFGGLGTRLPARARDSLGKAGTVPGNRRGPCEGTVPVLPQSPFSRSCPRPQASSWGCLVGWFRPVRHEDKGRRWCRPPEVV